MNIADFKGFPEPMHAMLVSTDVASTPVECLVWEKENLRKLTRRRPEYLNVIHAAIGKDLARKTAQHNLKLSEA